MGALTSLSRTDEDMAALLEKKNKTKIEKRKRKSELDAEDVKAIGSLGTTLGEYLRSSIELIFEYLPLSEHLNLFLTARIFFRIGHQDYWYKRYCQRIEKSEYFEGNVEVEKPVRRRRVDWKTKTIKLSNFSKYKLQFETKDETYFNALLKRDMKEERVRHIEPKVKFRVTLVGGRGSGKTSMCRRFSGIPFNPEETDTIGISLSSLEIGDAFVKFFDVGSGKGSMTLRNQIIHSSNMLILCFSLDNKSSFNFVKSKVIPWIIGEGLDKKIPSILVGTKLDLKQDRRISEFSGWKLATKNNNIGRYIELSSKTNENIPILVGSIYEEAIRGLKEDEEFEASLV